MVVCHSQAGLPLTRAIIQPLVVAYFDSVNEDTWRPKKLWELRQPAGGGRGFGEPANQPPSLLAGHLASNHPAGHHCFVHASLPHRPCSQDLKMMSPFHGVCSKISFPLNKTHHALAWGFQLFARVGIRT